MTAVDSSANEGQPVSVDVTEAEELTEQASTGPMFGDPLMLGLPAFIAGATALGLVLVGVVPATATGASLPIILAATAVGLVLATIWAASLGQNAVASVLGIFAGFWFSYAVLVLGLTHNWFGITAAAAQSTQELFLVSWLVVIVMLTLATLRLPVAFTALFFLVDVALLLVFLGVNQGSTGLLKTGGYVVLVFTALGVYLFFGAASLATGGPAMPLGKPLLHR
ncbi:MAG TPA: GPR1/FUN34/YaaH family transporter [Streptosporangiaceae bacterium]